MKPNKKLYIYVIKTFIPLFLGSFTVAWFVVVMQLLWRFVDDIVGKGIEPLIFLKLMFFAAMTVAPLALILAILIASLMTFGNLGERLELLAMRSAGIPLIRIFKPLLWLSILLGIGLFIFQNDWMITSQVKFWQYYFSIKNKSPELAIPTGVFYKDLEGYSIYVERKDPARKMMYGMMLYEYKNGFENATVLRADSGWIYSPKGGKVLTLELMSGESFRNLREKKNNYSSSSGKEPYMREHFERKIAQIPFDANLNMVDEGILSSQFVGKNMFQLKSYIDSLQLEIDSVALSEQMTVLSNPSIQTFQRAGRSSTVHTPITEDALTTIREEESFENGLNPYKAGIEDSDGNQAPSSLETEMDQKVPPPIEENIDHNPKNYFDGLTPEEKAKYDIFSNWNQIGLRGQKDLYARAERKITTRKGEIYVSSTTQDDLETTQRKNLFEFWRKFTYPIACIVFFLVGAPLGALIRKGGVGIPFIVAVFFFIIFYFLEMTGMKMARDGQWQAWFGMWLPNIVLFPVGVWLCYIATKDSNKLSFENISSLLQKLFRSNTVRSLPSPHTLERRPANYIKGEEDIQELYLLCEQLQSRGKMQYMKFFLGEHRMVEKNRINDLIESLIQNLQHDPDILLVHRLGALPDLRNVAKTYRPKPKCLSFLMMLFIPGGLLLYLYYRVRERVYISEIGRLIEVTHQIRDEIRRVSEHRHLANQ